MRPFAALIVAFTLFSSILTSVHADTLDLTLRKRVPVDGHDGLYRPVFEKQAWDTSKTAIIVCDMWDTHTSQNAANRTAEIAPRMNDVLVAARSRGVLIIHAPSDTMDYYKDHPARKRAMDAPTAANLPKEIGRWCYKIPAEEKGEYPLDQSDGGADDDPAALAKWKEHLKAERGDRKWPWMHEIDTLKIDESKDAISDKGVEIWNLLESRGIDNVILMGVHTNMCVLGRPFGLRQMAQNGKNVVLMRDLTDTMYNPAMRPFVNHHSGTDLIIEHIEKHVCATVTSGQIIGGEPARFASDTRPRIVLIVGEREYHTHESLTKFAEDYLRKDFRVTFVVAESDEGPGRDVFPGMADAIKTADVVLISARRRAPATADMAALKAYVMAGKPIVGIRTASHAFSLHGKPAPEGHDTWEKFDPEVWGGNYTNHWGKDLKARVKATDRVTHPIMTGVSTPFDAGGSLYKANPLEKDTEVILNGMVEGHPTEPVAWTHKHIGGGRAFYTSLGHVDDFANASFDRLLRNGIYWAAGLEVPDDAPKVNMTPDDSLKAMTHPDDLAIDLVLAEPQIAQPVFFNFDERGRMWVVEYRQYPNPAGLKEVSHDKYFRTVYDKVPQPPGRPGFVPGADRITIHEDKDGDGTFETHKVFLDGLNIVTAVERGRGGVFVLNPPYLLFYPDKDNDDVPDTLVPDVLLEGFGLEDTHSCVNSLRWGPDGWLYAAQGSTVTGNVKRYGTDDEPIHTMGQLIWRYHPERKIYEVFAEGGGNAFGVEIDSKGRIFSGHNGGNTRGFHYVQGAYLQKGFSKHGPLSNPYAFGYFDAMPHNNVKRFSHNFIIYEGDSLPEKYRGKVFAIDPLNRNVTLADITPDGSTFKTQDIGYAMETTDTWCRPVDIKLGPDGAVYFADFYEQHPSHRQHHEGFIGHDTGRIYRIRAADRKPGYEPFDMAKMSAENLVDQLRSENRWQRQTALRVAVDRESDARLMTQVFTATDGGDRGNLDLYWARHLKSPDSAHEVIREGHVTFDSALGTPAPIRTWMIRLFCDDGEIPDKTATHLAIVASKESDIEVRSQLAASAKRLPPEQSLPIIANLMKRDEDVNDRYIPLQIWWALEAACTKDAPAVLALFEKETELWSRPIVRVHILPRLMRRFAAAGSRSDLLICAKLLNIAPTDDARHQLMGGFEQAYEGRSLSGLPRELVDAIAKAGGGSLALRVRQGDAKAVAEAVTKIGDTKTKTAERIELVRIFGEAPTPDAIPALITAATSGGDASLRKAALTALQPYDDTKIADAVLGAYAKMPTDVQAAALTLLSSRAAWTTRLVNAVSSGAIDKAAIPTDMVANLRLHDDASLRDMVARLWGKPTAPTSDEMRQQIAQLGKTIADGPGDPYKGKALFLGTCGACHTLHNTGGHIGPDLTTFKRDDIPTMLLNIVNPNAEIREGFESFIVSTNDGRTLSGFLADQDKSVVVLRGLDGQNITVQREQVKSMTSLGRSLMPEKLLDALSEQQVRDLFAYLRTSQPLNN
ncbi:MAG: isochorismatase family protein [Phycisphaera sp.]|nr:isochorismatase family protein [Phycisphaera sp.]